MLKKLSIIFVLIFLYSLSIRCGRGGEVQWKCNSKDHTICSSFIMSDITTRKRSLTNTPSELKLSFTPTTDLLVKHNSSNDLLSFTTAVIANNAEGARAVRVADMDGDGDLDIVSASFFDNTIAWYENDGSINPAWTATDISISADGAYDVHIADMDRDGDLDIVSASSNDDTIAWYENNGAVNPSWNPSNIATNSDGANDIFVADLDGDGDLDIVSASFFDDTIAWYENDGSADPHWTKVIINTNADGAKAVYVADMDGDSDLDIVSASYSNDTIAWYENDGQPDPSWTTIDIAKRSDNSGLWDVYVADLDADGDLDIVSASSNDDTIAWYENDGKPDPSWIASDIDTRADFARGVYVADLDGDGDLDIVSASSGDDKIAWYQNDGSADPIWSTAKISSRFNGVWGVHVADLDGDGDLDIVSASTYDNTIAWYENKGQVYLY